MTLRSLLVLAIACAAARSQAQPAAAQAEVLFRNGKRLLKQGKVAEACASFDASQKLEPTVSTQLNQANCREKNNQLATAWGLFLDAERDTRAASDDAGRQLHQVAVDHADKLEPRLSTLELRVAADVPTGGLEIRRDGELIDPAAWNQQLPIDGGTYRISAHSRELAAWSTTVTIGNEHDAKIVEIPKPAVAKAAPAPVKAAPVAPPPPPAVKLAAPDTWYCTASSFVKIGTCKPQLDACEAFRARMLGHVRDLPACAATQTATCFTIAGDPHCAPTSEMCGAMRDAADRAGGTALGGCEARRATKIVAKPAQAPAAATGDSASVDFDDPSEKRWSCTESVRSTGVGTCKPTSEQCEAFRAKLLERFQDLSECHGVAVARCFDLAKEPHCTPNEPICEAQRVAATKQGKTSLACYPKRAQ